MEVNDKCVGRTILIVTLHVEDFLLNKHDRMRMVIDLLLEHIVALHDMAINRYCDIFIGGRCFNKSVKIFPNIVV